MTTDDWRSTETNARQMRLLGWLEERAVGGVIPNLAPFYEDDESRTDQARRDHDDLAHLGWIRTASGGGLAGLAADPTPLGRQMLARWAAKRGDRPPDGKRAAWP